MIQLSSIGGSEWLWIALVAAVLLFGSKKLPEVARSLGKAMGEFQKGKMEIEREMQAAAQQVTLAETPRLSAQVPTKKEELQKAAAALGIDASSKSEEELKKAIKEKLV